MSSARKPEDMTDKELKEGIVAMEAEIGLVISYTPIHSSIIAVAAKKRRECARST